MNISTEPQDHIGVLANGSRTYKQFLDMLDKISRGECPFCPEYLDPKKNVIIGRSVSGESEWVMWVNPYPHKHTDTHIIMIPTRHLSHMRDLTGDDWICIGGLNRRIHEQFDIPGGGFAMRFGDPTYNAGSLEHLHANIMVPDLTGNVKVTLAKDENRQALANQRVEVFMKLHEAGITVEQAKDWSIAQNTVSQEEYRQFVADNIE